VDEVASLPPFAISSPREARHVIAQAMLSGEGLPSGSVSLGSITLQNHQLSAVARAQASIAEFGGVLLCDPVGTGKTYVALAVATSFHIVRVVAPAVLRHMWVTAAESAGMTILFDSVESLKRGAPCRDDHDFLIVDEAHHARNPATQRFARLSRIASRCPVMLLTATPIHNHRRDLVAVLSLFLGERADALTDSDLARCVVRREKRPHNRLIPEVQPLRWRELPEDENMPKRLLALPPPLPPRDASDGGALIAFSLVRQWASSEAALAGGLRRRLHRAVAIISALESGTYPSRAELSAWISTEDSLQLAFAELVAPASGDCAVLLPVVSAHRDGVMNLIADLDPLARCDLARAAIVRDIRQRHPESRIIAFSQYAETVTAMFRLLAPDGQVAALTGTMAWVAGGVISRQEAIGRFAPTASGRGPPSRSDTVTLLITTDLLSEGVNLQDADVVIHLDLPWTPARMEQRLGRIARIGSEHARVYAYALKPPAAASALTGIERVLVRKMDEAGIITDRFPSFPWGEGTNASLASTPRLAEATHDLISEWLDNSSSDPADARWPLVSAVAAGRAGFLAVCSGTNRAFLIGSLDDRITDDPATLHECVELAAGESVPATGELARSALKALRVHLDSARALSGIVTGPRAHTRDRAFRRIASAVAHARPHDRARIAALAVHARQVIDGRYGAHADRELGDLDGRGLPDERWLHAVIDIGQRFVSAPVDVHGDVKILALIVFCTDDD